MGFGDYQSSQRFQIVGVLGMRRGMQTMLTVEENLRDAQGPRQGLSYSTKTGVPIAWQGLRWGMQVWSTRE